MKKFVRNLMHLFDVIFGRRVGHAQHRPAHCGNILTLLLHLCDFDHDMCTWILRWIAYPLRHPGAKMSTAIVINGGPATGKSLFFKNVVAELHGANGRVIGSDRLRGYFTGWAANARFAAVDGSFSSLAANRLKDLLTAESIVIERRGEPPYSQPNQLNLVFLSTGLGFLPESVASRRFLIVETPPARARTFYQAVAYEIANGGLEAFREYLVRELDMGNFNTSTQPPKARTSKQREAA